MIDITKKTWKKSSVETIVLHGIKQLNENHIEQRLDHENLPIITRKYQSEYRKHRYELVKEPKK